MEPEWLLRMVFFRKAIYWTSAPLAGWYASSLLPLILANVLVADLLARERLGVPACAVAVAGGYIFTLLALRTPLMAMEPLLAFRTVIQSSLEQIASIKPTLAFIDFGLPGMKGDELIWRIKRELPNTQAIAISGIADNSVFFDAIAAGADGFLHKPLRKARFFEHVNDLLAGGMPLSKRARKLLVDEWRKTVSHVPLSLLGLTDREKALAEMVGQGVTYEAIATRLEISRPTVEEHVRHIYDKLHIHSRPEMQRKRYHPPPDSGNSRSKA